MPMGSHERPWARHYQEAWHSRAGDKRLPYWLRVAALAYGSHQDNGHATFKRGEIGMVLACVDSTTGTITPYENVGRAITDAVAYGWLEPESFWGCLIVPAHAIKKGAHGRGSACPIHMKRRGRKDANRSLSDGYGSHSPTPDERFEERIPHSVSGSQREPFSLLSPPTATQRPAAPEGLTA
jgi:hypothetical protein